jgi:hypothetical protein
LDTKGHRTRQDAQEEKVIHLKEDTSLLEHTACMIRYIVSISGDIQPTLKWTNAPQIKNTSNCKQKACAINRMHCACTKSPAEEGIISKSHCGIKHPSSSQRNTNSQAAVREALILAQTFYGMTSLTDIFGLKQENQPRSMSYKNDNKFLPDR